MSFANLYRDLSYTAYGPKVDFKKEPLELEPSHHCSRKTHIGKPNTDRRIFTELIHSTIGTDRGAERNLTTRCGR